MKLVIAEKPSVGLEIAKALGCRTRRDGFCEGGGYVVSWAAGHLVELKAPEDYGATWTWRNCTWQTLPMLPQRFELRVSESGKKQFSVLERLFARKDVALVINACDAGREGELIFDYIYRMVGSKLPVERLWTSAALTREAILKEFRNLKAGEAYSGLRMAARARAAADWLVGMNGTRAVTLAARGTLFSVGRVQTPTLAFLVERETHIRAFVPEAFSTVTVAFAKDNDERFEARYEFRADAQGRRSHQIKDPDHTAAVVAALKGPDATFWVSDVVERKKIEKPPYLYNLTALQKDANRVYGFSAERTLDIAQALYEKHKALTYPRTESRHLPEALRGELPGVIEALAAQAFPQEAIALARERLEQRNGRVFDDAKVTDHHALLPTRSAPSGLNQDEGRLYAMVARRFLAAFHDDFVTAITDATVTLVHSPFTFHAKGKVVIQPGWSVVERPPAMEQRGKAGQGNKASETGEVGKAPRSVTRAQGGGDDADSGDGAEGPLPMLVRGEFVHALGHKVKEDVTKPPRRLTEADVLALMETAGNRLEEDSEKEILKGRGIGTPATRANIIQTLLRREYAVMQGKALCPTEKAIVLIENLRADVLKSAALTAALEADLAALERGELKAGAFAEKLNAFVRALVEGARQSSFQSSVRSSVAARSSTASPGPAAPAGHRAGQAPPRRRSSRHAP